MSSDRRTMGIGGEHTRGSMRSRSGTGCDPIDRAPALAHTPATAGTPRASVMSERSALAAPSMPPAAPRLSAAAQLWLSCYWLAYNLQWTALLAIVLPS